MIHGMPVESNHDCFLDDYFVRHLSLSREDAVKLHRNYYTQYGLAIEGLVRHHQIDPLDYNRQVDDALPLETVLSPDAQLRQLLQDFDKSKVRLWLLTNAYITHAKRVVKLLGVDDLFEGLTFCEYDAEKIICKPYKEMYEKAQKEAGVSSPEDCYFVGQFVLRFIHTPYQTVHLTGAAPSVPR